MSFSRLFYIFAATILFVSGFTLVSPSLITSDLIYPLRVDSNFIRYREFQDPTDTIPDSLYFNPADIGLPYAELNITTFDSLRLDGWFILSKDTPAHTVLIIHDLNQSRLMYMDQLKQLYDRGLNICIYDLRGHGSSDGNEFSAGKSGVADAKKYLAELKSHPGINKVILFGIGIGSEIALQTAIEDTLCDGLVLENPILDLGKFLNRYSFAKWGKMQTMWLPVLTRKVEKLLQKDIHSLNMLDNIKKTAIPMLFLAGNQDSICYGSETLMIYQNSISYKKDFLLLAAAGHTNMAQAGGEKYYNKIASFINVTFPKIKKTRFKKLAQN